MNRKIIFGILFFISTTYYSCGFYSNIYKGMSTSGFVVVLNVLKLRTFEKDISCFYYQNNEFPYDVNKFKEYIDTSQICDNLFSKLELKNRDINKPEYCFELLPFTTYFDNDSSNLFVDSIRINDCSGNISFSDSLLSKNIDSIHVEIKILSVESQIYDSDSVYNYNSNNDRDIVIDDFLKRIYSDNISLKKSCN